MQKKKDEIGKKNQKLGKIEITGRRNWKIVKYLNYE